MSVARIAVPDLVSNSYFPAIAAIELGFFAREGLDVAHELIFPNYKAYEALRDGKIDFVGGAAHAVPSAFPNMICRAGGVTTVPPLPKAVGT